jgi:hypothetical protein
MWDAATQIHRLKVRVSRQPVRKTIQKALHIGIEFGHIRARSNVGVQQHRRHALALGSLRGSGDVFKPDTVLRAGAARVTGLHVSVPETRVET